jgi:hypothetical protein
MNTLTAATPLAVAALLGAGLPTAAHATAASAASSPSCAPLQQKAKKAARSGKKAKAKRLKQRFKTCRNEATIRSALAGYTFAGTRGDGQPISITLCANGNWSSRTGSRPVAISSGSTWFVRFPQFTSTSAWVTQVAENKDRRQGGWSVGVARQGDAFQVGIASFEDVSSLGPVTRAPAGAACPA